MMVSIVIGATKDVLIKYLLSSDWLNKGTIAAINAATKPKMLIIF